MFTWLPQYLRFYNRERQHSKDMQDSDIRCVLLYLELRLFVNKEEKLERIRQYIMIHPISGTHIHTISHPYIS